MKCEVYQSKRNGKYYWRVRARNGEIIARSCGGKGGGYTRQGNAANSAMAVLKPDIKIVAAEQ